MFYLLPTFILSECIPRRLRMFLYNQMSLSIDTFRRVRTISHKSLSTETALRGFRTSSFMKLNAAKGRTQYARVLFLKS